MPKIYVETVEDEVGKEDRSPKKAGHFLEELMSWNILEQGRCRGKVWCADPCGR